MQGNAYSLYHLKGNTLKFVEMRNVGEYNTLDLEKDHLKKIPLFFKCKRKA